MTINMRLLDSIDIIKCVDRVNHINLPSLGT